jgi:hypothetical protein
MRTALTLLALVSSVSLAGAALAAPGGTNAMHSQTPVMTQTQAPAAQTKQTEAKLASNATHHKLGTKRTHHSRSASTGTKGTGNAKSAKSIPH